MERLGRSLAADQLCVCVGVESWATLCHVEPSTGLCPRIPANQAPAPLTTNKVLSTDLKKLEHGSSRQERKLEGDQASRHSIAAILRNTCI